MAMITEKQLEYIARKQCEYYCSEDDLWYETMKKGRHAPFVTCEEYVEKNWKDYVDEAKQFFEWYLESKKEVFY